MPLSILFKKKEVDVTEIRYIHSIWLRGWDLNHTVLPFSLRKKRLRSPRGENSPPDCFLTPLGRSLSVAASDLFALRSHNPSVALFKISLVAKKYRQQKCCLYFLVAGVGLEPHDLRVMSPTSCQLLYPAISD